MKWYGYGAAQSACAHPERRMMHLKQHGVTALRIEKMKAEREDIEVENVIVRSWGVSSFWL